MKVVKLRRVVIRADAAGRRAISRIGEGESTERRADHEIIVKIYVLGICIVICPSRSRPEPIINEVVNSRCSWIASAAAPALAAFN